MAKSSFVSEAETKTGNESRKSNFELVCQSHRLKYYLLKKFNSVQGFNDY